MFNFFRKKCPADAYSSPNNQYFSNSTIPNELNNYANYADVYSTPLEPRTTSSYSQSSYLSFFGIKICYRTETFENVNSLPDPIEEQPRGIGVQQLTKW